VDRDRVYHHPGLELLDLADFGGLLVDPATGIISGTPTEAGTFVVTIGAANSTAGATATLNLAIAKGTATIELQTASQTPLTVGYDGTKKAVTATTIPSGRAVTFTYTKNGVVTEPIYPGTYTVVAKIDDPNYAGETTQTFVITIAVLVNHAPTLGSIVDGSVQMLLPENLSLKGSTLSGDLLVPGTPKLQLNGNPTYAGLKYGPGSETPKNYTLTLGGGVVVRYLVRHIDAIELPTATAPAAPGGSRDVTLTAVGQGIGDPATLRNLTLKEGAGQVAVPPGTYGAFLANNGTGFVFGVAGATEPAIYDLQSLSLNESSTLQVVGPVILTLASGPTISGTAGNADHAGWLALNVYSGGVTLNTGATLRAIVSAPAGTVTLNDSATLEGRIAADGLTLKTNALLDEVAP